MTRRVHRVVTGLGGGLVLLALAGCISIGPKGDPARLYRFGQTTASLAASTADSGGVGVSRALGSFQRGAGGDRLLTVNGETAAYIAETRWIAPANVLWDEAVLAAFDADSGPARLVTRGEPGAADIILRLDVRTFETRYDRGAKAAPVVAVRVRGALIRAKDQSLISERIFQADARAAANKVSAIVPAYDRAVTDVLADIVAWTNAEAGER